MNRQPRTLSTPVLHSGNMSSDFWYGPYVSLPPGKYEASFRLKIDGTANGEVMELRIGSWPLTIWKNLSGNNATGYHINWAVNATGSEKVVATKIIYGENFTYGKYCEFSIGFNVTVFGTYEFFGVNAKSPVNVYFDVARVRQVEPDFKFITDLR